MILPSNSMWIPPRTGMNSGGDKWDGWVNGICPGELMLHCWCEIWRLSLSKSTFLYSGGVIISFWLLKYTVYMFFLTMTIACSPGAQNVETGFVSDRPSWNMQWWKQAMAEILITFKIRTVLNNYVHQVAVLIGLQEPSQWLHSSWVMTWSYTVCTTWIQSVLKIHLPRTHRSVNWSRTPRKSPFRRRGKWVENGGCLEGQVR